MIAHRAILAARPNEAAGPRSRPQDWATVR